MKHVRTWILLGMPCEGKKIVSARKLHPRCKLFGFAPLDNIKGLIKHKVSVERMDASHPFVQIFSDQISYWFFVNKLNFNNLFFYMSKFSKENWF